jgi:2-polyprenyl-3-methyl-5-hydroxy-6-metoxy-1,4-benzoquinol methylase
MDFSARAELTEQMDAPELDEASYQRCLQDLAAVNRVTFTHRPTLRWLACATRRYPKGMMLSVLDVAYGQGDLLRAIARWAKKRGFVAQLSGVDLNPRSAIAANAATPPGLAINYRTGDVFDFSPAPLPDYIVTSQFTHHLTDQEVVRLLHWLEAHAKRGWHIADLHRHPFAYYGFPLLARLMRWHAIVRNDGRISIARAFTRRDWEALLRQAGLEAQIAWHVGFRFSISRLK